MRSRQIALTETRRLVLTVRDSMHFAANPGTILGVYKPQSVLRALRLTAIFAALVVAIIVVCAGLLAHVALDRRRLAGWGAQWRATGPQWTRQR